MAVLLRSRQGEEARLHFSRFPLTSGVESRSLTGIVAVGEEAFDSSVVLWLALRLLWADCRDRNS
eukprot:7147578-Prorocentrum_lima.AAC.1